LLVAKNNGEVMLLEVKYIPGKGRGVFAVTPISEGVNFECSPIIELPKKHILQIRRTVIGDYFFRWGEKRREGAIALGYGSLYNHSYTPNANFKLNMEENMIEFYSLRAISAGEEVTINYKGDPESQSKVWFDVLE